MQDQAGACKNLRFRQAQAGACKKFSARPAAAGTSATLLAAAALALALAVSAALAAAAGFPLASGRRVFPFSPKIFFGGYAKV